MTSAPPDWPALAAASTSSSATVLRTPAAPRSILKRVRSSHAAHGGAKMCVANPCGLGGKKGKRVHFAIGEGEIEEHVRPLGQVQDKSKGKAVEVDPEREDGPPVAWDGDYILPFSLPGLPLPRASVAASTAASTSGAHPAKRPRLAPPPPVPPPPPPMPTLAASLPPPSMGSIFSLPAPPLHTPLAKASPSLPLSSIPVQPPRPPPPTSSAFLPSAFLPAPPALPPVPPSPPSPPPPPPPEIIDSEPFYHISRILAQSTCPFSGGQVYLVEWLGYPREEASWVTREDLEEAEALDRWEEEKRQEKEREEKKEGKKGKKRRRRG